MSAELPELVLFFDDTGSRQPDQEPTDRDDGFDCFGLGGILINEEDIEAAKDAHKVLAAKWELNYPLHSHAIRGGRDNFDWLKSPEKAVDFYADLNEFLTKLPIICLAAVIHRPGYVERYSAKYAGKPWDMDKTAFVILIERAAKFAFSVGRKLRVYYERSGAVEDERFTRFIRELKTTGLPFDGSNSAAYDGLSAAEFKEIVRGEPRGQTKSSRLLQVADLVLYPMAKAGYDPSYRAYQQLKAANLLIDDHVPPEDINKLGIKYSCFPTKKAT